MSFTTTPRFHVHSTTSVSPPPPAAARKSFVLLVDDHPITRKGLRVLIEGQPGFSVCAEVENGEQALACVAATRPDVAIVDISLPSANGIELTRLMKARAPEMPILVLSMHDENIYAERALRAGANGYLMKQEAGDSVVPALRKVLQGDVFLSARMRDRMAGRFFPKRRNSVTFAIDTLSDREREVFELLGEGFSTRQISEKLGLSSKTIDSYREHLKLKLGLKSGAELVHHAIQWGWSKEPA